MARRKSTTGLGLLGVGAASVIAHNAATVLATRRKAKALRVPLDHDGFVGQGLGDPTWLWVLGDSASDGYGLQDSDDAFPRHVANVLASGTSRRIKLTSLGRDGARIADVTREQVPMIQQAADAIAILVGANDVFGRRSGKEVRADTEELVTAVQAAAPGAILAVAGCPDFGKAGGFPQPLRLLLGWRCRVTAKAIGDACEGLGVPFVDIVPDTRPDLFGEDGVHPNRAASVAMSEGIVAAMLASASNLQQGN